MSWIGFGLRRGILTTRYPQREETMPNGYRGEIEVREPTIEETSVAADFCLSHAISTRNDVARVDALRCFQCGECTRVAPDVFVARNRFEIARLAEPAGDTLVNLRDRVRAFGRSVHLRHIDTGSDGSEEQELAAIFNPFYDVNRLGIFLTATPRHADVLVVTGAVTKAMADPLRRTFEAMPEPKIVVALGTTACSGGILRDAPHVVGPVSAIVPVDVFIPGSPPAPLSILHGLWVALGRVIARGASA